MTRPHSVYPFICQWAPELLPPSGYCASCCYEHRCENFSVKISRHSFRMEYLHAGIPRTPRSQQQQQKMSPLESPCGSSIPKNARCCWKVDFYLLPLHSVLWCSFIFLSLNFLLCKLRLMSPTLSPTPGCGEIT